MKAFATKPHNKRIHTYTLTTTRETMYLYRHILLTILSVLISVCAVAQEDEDMRFQDSLYSALCATKDDMHRLKIIHEIARSHPNLDSVEHYAKKEVELAKRLGKPHYESLGYSYLGWKALVSSEYSSASNYIFRSISISDSLGEKDQIAYDYTLLGDSYMLTNDISSANANYQKAIEIYQEIDDKEGICEVLVQMAQIDNENMMYEMAEECAKKAHKIYSEIGEIAGVGHSLAIIGDIYYTKYGNTRFTNHDPSLLDIAQSYTREAISKINSNSHASSVCNNRYADILLSKAAIATSPVNKAMLLDSSKIYIDRAIEISQTNGLTFPETQYDMWLILSKKYKEAHEATDSVYNNYKNDLEHFADNNYQFLELYSTLYEHEGNHKEALRMSRIYNELRHNSHKTDFAANAARNMAKNEFDQQLLERELHYQAENLIRNAILIFISVFLIMAIVMIVIIIRSYRRSREINHILDNQNNELTTINKQMTDGINYASVIQRAALPSDTQLSSTFGQHLLIYRPLSTISGDFYWSTQIGRYKFLAVADSTGHGVPGALLSMLGISTLNEIATRVNINNPSAGDMLNDMRRAFKESLHQNGNLDENHDGIDISLVIIDSSNLTMRYAGAFRPIAIVRDGTFHKLKADRMPIGTHHNESNHFTDHTFQLRADDVIYLYTDGMTDQYGFDEGHNFRKFTSQRFSEMILDIHKLPFDEQKERIDATYTKWRTINNSSEELCEQTDDALIIGIRIEQSAPSLQQTLPLEF